MKARTYLRYDPRRSLYEQFAGQNPGMSLTSIMVSVSRDSRETCSEQTPGQEYPQQMMMHPSPAVEHPLPSSGFYAPNTQAMLTAASMVDPVAIGPYGVSPAVSTAVTFQRTLFEGSPAYKRRRVRSRQTESPLVEDASTYRRRSPGQLSQTSDLRGTTMSPRAPYRKVGAREASPKRTKRQSSSAAPERENERLYVCAQEQCRRPFKRLEHLKRHVRTHTMERPYECHKCSRSFSRQDNLVQHLRTHGSGEDVSYHGLGIGTPPPREGVDYFVANGGNMPAYRWATASPAGEGYHSTQGR